MPVITERLRLQHVMIDVLHRVDQGVVANVAAHALFEVVKVARTSLASAIPTHIAAKASSQWTVCARVQAFQN